MGRKRVENKRYFLDYGFCLKSGVNSVFSVNC
jgi:hypothetical protein